MNTHAAVSGVQNDAIYPVPITSGTRGVLADGPDFYPSAHGNRLKDQEGKSRENRAVSAIFTRPLASSYSSTSLTSLTRGERSWPAASSIPDTFSFSAPGESPAPLPRTTPDIHRAIAKVERKVDEMQFILQNREGDGSQNTAVGEPVLHYQSKTS